jgi:hypothetical protein
MRYRGLKCGEVVEATDEYQSVFSQGTFIPVSECTIGQQLLDCNVPYYRRPLKAAEDCQTATNTASAPDLQLTLEL